MIGLALALVAGPAQLPAERGVYSVGFAMPAGAKIGNKRSGALCLPAGSWRLSDVRQGEGAIIRAVEQGLRAAGRPVRSSANAEFSVRAATTEWRLSAEVTALALNSCAAWGPTRRVIGDSGRLRGAGTITVRWRLYSTAARAVVREGETTARFDFAPEVSDLAGAIEQGLVASALQLGPEWWHD